MSLLYLLRSNRGALTARSKGTRATNFKDLWLRSLPSSVESFDENNNRSSDWRIRLEENDFGVNTRRHSRDQDTLTLLVSRLSSSFQHHPHDDDDILKHQSTNRSMTLPASPLLGNSIVRWNPRVAAFYTHQQLFFSTSSSDKKLSRRLGTTKIPTPPSSPKDTSPLERLRETTPASLLQKVSDLSIRILKTVGMFLLRLPGNIWFYMTNPDELGQKWADIKQAAQDEVNHYWMGFKLLWADVQTAKNLVGRTLQGSSLTRRERKQLLRTVTDLFRLVPFSMFIIIPFMEFALPFALRLFPNMLPSTFQDSLKSEETMKRELQSRIAMTQFFQETLEQLAKEQKRKAETRKKELAEAGVEGDDDTITKQEDSAVSMLQFLEKARNGEIIPPDVIIRYANYFQDDLTLDNMPRMQLINLCKYMSIPPYGSDAFLRFQLRHKIRILKDDDQRILWEGIDSLTKMELREACQERGMRSTGLSKEAYKRSLQQWLDLSVNKNVPISLLIMSRIFFLREEMFEKKSDSDDVSKSLAGLADAMSGLDKEVLNEVILEVATSEEKLSDPEIRKLKLEVLAKQNELIKQEQAARDASTKRKSESATASEKADSSLGDTSAGSSPSSSAGAPEVEVGTVPQKETEAPPALDGSNVATDTVADEEPTTEEKERDLSTEEMDAISHLVSDDPVSKERAELERIKAAMRAKDESSGEAGGDEKAKPVGGSTGPEVSAKIPEPSYVDDSVHVGGQQSSTSSHQDTADTTTSFESDAVKDVDSKMEDDPVVARLKKRIESMVDKIEVQLSHVQVKIGDKLHFLDKDRDGVLSREEMAEVLQQVLKRKISFEEAMEIASEMDENRDGFFTVDELIKWIDKHKLVRFVEEGRDADMDRIIESQVIPDQPKDDEVDQKGETKK